MRTSNGRYEAGLGAVEVPTNRPMSGAGGDPPGPYEAVRLELDPLVIQAAPDLQIIHRDATEALPLRSGAAIDPGPAVSSSEAFKRAFDVAVAAVALVVTLPVWLAVTVVAVFGRQGPVLYAQERVGRYGTIFKCLKFRTMHQDADRALQRVLDDDGELARQWAEHQKLDRDPRITPLGRILRRFDLDEIPQFVNVLRGEMSVVGPRPVVPGEAERFGDDLAVVLAVRPGITGLWQVSGRNEMLYEERVRREATYARTRSFLGDLTICARTPVVLLRRNAAR